jgi:HEAT repeat protein
MVFAMNTDETTNTPRQIEGGLRAGSPHAWTDDEIAALVGDLDSVYGGELTAAALIGIGPRVIPFVSDFLLKGMPRSVYQPRQHAVEVLGELGAKDVLIAYLLQERGIPDLVVRHAEEGVKSAAGRELGRWKTEDVFQALREMARRRFLPGVVEALGEFRRPEVVDYFIAALGDGGCRAEAREALRKLGESARMAVLTAAITPQPSAEEESPSSRIRRREAVHLLGEWKLPASDWARVKPLLDDPDPEIYVHAAGIALAIAPGVEHEMAFRRLIAGLSAGDGFLQMEVDAILRRNYSQLRPVIEAEIAVRTQKTERERNSDRVLRVMLSIRERETERGDRESPHGGAGTP